MACSQMQGAPGIWGRRSPGTRQVTRQVTFPFAAVSSPGPDEADSCPEPQDWGPQGSVGLDSIRPAACRAEAGSRMP